MLHFNYKNDVDAKITFDEESRRDFDILREYFKTDNEAIKYMKSYRGGMSPFSYAITILGGYAIGMTKELCDKCDKLKIEYDVDEKLQAAIKPSFNIDDILSVPNEKYIYRDYQLELVERLCDNGRGVIISPTRSGKSLVIAGLIHNVFQNVYTTKCQNVIIVVPNVQLVWQFFDDLNEYGLGEYYNIQMFTAKTMSKKNAKVIVDKLNIYISNSQYLLGHGDELPPIDLIFMDECHGCTKGSEISKLLKKTKIVHKFGCTGTLPKNIKDKWMIAGVFGPVLDEVEIQQLQKDKILADVKVFPIQFVHRHKINFKVPSVDENGVKEDAYEAARKAYHKESMYLGTHEKTVQIEINLCKKLISEHPSWNFLVLFDFTEQGRLLFKSLEFENKHFIDGSIDVKERRAVVNEMDQSGGHITIAQSKTFSTGLTISRINCIMILTNQSACTKIIQSIGRRT